MTVLFSAHSPGPRALAATAGATRTELAELGCTPGAGYTLDLWEALATLAARDVAQARAAEPHLDAAAILAQSGAEMPSGSWGVFAAEGPQATLTAAEGLLTGTKPWCSLAGELDAALITASGGLWAVDLKHPGVTVEAGAWHARGLAEIPSGPVHFDAVPAAMVGAPGWYLSRPGFHWGGIGVAACWYGGAVGVGRAVFEATKGSSDQFKLMHLGAIDGLLQSARFALADAAEAVDRGDEGRILAKRVRNLVARNSEELLRRAGHAMGPAPLAMDEAYAKRVADLELYLRQHHAEKDEASLGEALAEGDQPW